MVRKFPYEMIKTASTVSFGHLAIPVDEVEVKILD